MAWTATTKNRPITTSKRATFRERMEMVRLISVINTGPRRVSVYAVHGCPPPLVTAASSTQVSAKSKSGRSNPDGGRRSTLA